ncbi:phosphonoacetaldehyde hydrolase [Pseudoalteromonas luteoviolacea]|uniref:Phosphonoacetaldehyde hydrolase n=1 Tax=Pseudoalteromonas luteoviolacea DSM 6061 TaxID=1365250 RepID=A0A166WUA0_9GAMM|nr:phosphonoacetaldehyde hydrolase [Pseudoalteromonas luteoviolacea]KZN38086.1 phosphonoacetaldehyde hydrolase [Pseudoalteromonas luteoviolacea DSM 6061]MBE0388895.1 phosphonoacetaldehyde hydrolase [Pseudoalteromonas luteoviolacea DSM 6061]
MKHIKALILDWAGTVVDYGSIAPTSIFVEAFKRGFDFDISLQEARGPMGMGKWDHISTLLNTPEISSRWQAQFGRLPSNQDVDHIYETFMPLQIAKVTQRAKPIEGTLDVIHRLQASGIKIGSCSGYPKPVMDVLVPASAEYGYIPDCVVASDECVAGSRPGPWMALENVQRLGISRVASCVKVDDSVHGITEGLNAGMWTIGLAITGNAVGLSEEEWRALDESQQQALAYRAYAQLSTAGAHYVIDSLADIEPVLLEIESKLARGERP